MNPDSEENLGDEQENANKPKAEEKPKEVLDFSLPSSTSPIIVRGSQPPPENYKSKNKIQNKESIVKEEK